MKTILLHVYADDAMDARLQVALDIARAYDAHIAALQVHNFLPTPDMGMGGIVESGIIVAELQKQDESYRILLEKRLAHEDVKWSWLEATGDPADELVANGNFADLILIGQPHHNSAERTPLPIAGEVTLHATAPVMVVPPSIKRFDPTGPIVVGWDGSREASHAVRMALPLLRRASAVHLLAVGIEKGKLPALDAPAWLFRHGVKSELHEVGRTRANAAVEIKAFADAQAASAIVMGAYGHSRLREAIFGGVTRELLLNSRIPLVMSH